MTAQRTTSHHRYRAIPFAWSSLSTRAFLILVLPFFLLPLLSTAQNPKLLTAAWSQVRDVVYDPSYVKLDYPGGDVDSLKGVCTDVVVRIYREIGVDLQKEVHEDMKAHFAAYPARKRFGQSSPDRNIDHRRVPNLETFFDRHGASLPTALDDESWKPGDVVIWLLPGNLYHIGMLVDKRGESGYWKVIHNIGGGQVVEDFLPGADITGHYRYLNSPGSN